jgi:predicted GIY-YIG superfamily endonuclease
MNTVLQSQPRIAEPAAACSEAPTALYRYFDDRDTLLYAGITGNLASRETSHVKSSRWMQLTARSEVARYPTRSEALAAERTAIETEGPIFNRQYNDTPEAVDRLQTYVAECGRPDLLVAESSPMDSATDALASERRLSRTPVEIQELPPLSRLPTCDISVNRDSGECGHPAVARVGLQWLCLAHLGEASLKFDAVAARFRRYEREHLDGVVAQVWE